MLAIPVDSKDATHSSKFFGNVKYFAILSDNEPLTFIQNGGVGSGTDTANFLIQKGVKKSVYSFMGNGLFDTLYDGGVSVYYVGAEPMKLDDIIASLASESLVKVTPANAQEMLDPGTATGSCECSTS